MGSQHLAWPPWCLEHPSTQGACYRSDWSPAISSPCMVKKEDLDKIKTIIEVHAWRSYRQLRHLETHPNWHPRTTPTRIGYIPNSNTILMGGLAETSRACSEYIP